jgi:hypothetical protein
VHHLLFAYIEFIMDQQVPEERKDSVTKTLAILGFIAIVILIVWLAVKVVALIPSAFSSLASIADSVYNTTGSKELVVKTKNSVVTAGEAFPVSWSKMRGGGTYGFEYDCADGVSVDIREESGAIMPVACDTFIDLENTTKMDLLINAEKERFTDVEYTITYVRDGAENVVTDSVITVVNTSIDSEDALTYEDAVMEDEEPEGEVAGEFTFATRPEPSTPAEPTTPTYTAGEPEVVANYVYQIPVSDPNGVVDLQVTHLGVGVVDDGIFIPLSNLEEDKQGAIRFEIKNVGTKTADDWSYEAALPSDIGYESGKQTALKPNERVVITLGFDGITRTGIEEFGVEVDAEKDVNIANNSYLWAVEVVD